MCCAAADGTCTLNFCLLVCFVAILVYCEIGVFLVSMRIILPTCIWTAQEIRQYESLLKTNKLLHRFLYRNLVFTLKAQFFLPIILIFISPVLVCSSPIVPAIVPGHGISVVATRIWLVPRSEIMGLELHIFPFSLFFFK